MVSCTQINLNSLLTSQKIQSDLSWAISGSEWGRHHPTGQPARGEDIERSMGKKVRIGDLGQCQNTQYKILFNFLQALQSLSGTIIIQESVGVTLI